MDLLSVAFWLGTVYILYRILDYLYRLPYIDYTEKRVLITGCDSGFGFDAAKRLDSLGVHVFAGCLTTAGEKQLLNSCSKKLKTFHLDLTDAANISHVFQLVKQSIPESTGLWALINNAAICGKVGPEDWLRNEDYQQVFDVNVLGLINMTMTFLPLIKQAGGRIINVASLSGRVCFPYTTPYSISKYAVECFSDAMRRQLKPYDVSVHVIEPSGYDTPLTQAFPRAVQHSWNQCPEPVKHENGEKYFHEVMNYFRNDVGSMMCSNLSHATRLYEHACLAKHPLTRYHTTKGEKYFITLMLVLPEAITDVIVYAMNKQTLFKVKVKSK